MANKRYWCKCGKKRIKSVSWSEKNINPRKFNGMGCLNCGRMWYFAKDVKEEKEHIMKLNKTELRLVQLENGYKEEFR